MAGDGRYRVGIDSGGTFTNVCAIRSKDGSIFTAKMRANPADPSFALASALREILNAADCTDPSNASFLIHGYTLATNALLESQENRIGLLITQGHPHLLEAARQKIPPDSGNATTDPPPPRSARQGVRGRGTDGPSGAGDSTPERGAPA